MIDVISNKAKIGKSVRDRLATGLDDQRVEIVALVDLPSAPRQPHGRLSERGRRGLMTQKTSLTQGLVRRIVSRLKPEFTQSVRVLGEVGAFAASATEGDIQKLASMPEIRSIVLNQEVGLIR